MTADAYLRVVSYAYDEVFSRTRGLAPRDQYMRFSDGRHGGLLDLDGSDSSAFQEWFHGSKRHGNHPWEVVYGVPHGIVIAPEPVTGGRWRLRLQSGSEALNATAAQMAIGLGHHDIPFHFLSWKEVHDALAGLDYIAVGPGAGALPYEVLAEANPDSIDAIRWTSPAELRPISRGQAIRVAEAMGG